MSEILDSNFSTIVVH